MNTSLARSAVGCKVPTGRASRAAQSAPSLKRDVRVFNKRSRKGMPLGYVDEDNSGKANIFGVMPSQLYSSSPTADKAASTGIGGTQGVIILLVITASVVAGLSGVLLTGNSESLSSVAAGYDGDSLTALSSRISESI
ncbi:hypothetical protein BSKO_06280 [Bryopsis sp. KO-2023]|nr:hypothetical protein BSKO_06280 [Bryopsis sp. KO-2023]